MPRNYSEEASEITPYKLSRRDYEAIGRLARGCAEMEEALFLWLCRLLNSDPIFVDVLLGRMAVSARVKLSANLSAMHGEAFAMAHKNNFGEPTWADIFRCRNAVIHGVLMGKDDDGRIAFKTSEILETSKDEKLGSKLISEVLAYSTEEIKAHAAVADHVAPAMIKNLGLEALQEKRFLRTLVPHPKSNPQKKRDTKPQRPPRSS